MDTLALAYLGDAVFELYVRKYIIENMNITVGDMNTLARSLVSAAAQAGMYGRLCGVLSDEEMRVMKRGRNAKGKSVPKSCAAPDYRRATGLEVLFGFLFLSGRDNRLKEVFDICIRNDGEAL